MFPHYSKHVLQCAGRYTSNTPSDRRNDFSYKIFRLKTNFVNNHVNKLLTGYISCLIELKKFNKIANIKKIRKQVISILTEHYSIQ